jgi:hypothetical protein
MEILDYISADTVDAGDYIMVGLDPVEVKSVLEEDDSVVITGFSYESGDTVTYILPYDKEVGIWGA